MNKLQKKVGPLPVWGWAAAVALGIALYYYRTHGSTAPIVGGAVANPQAQLTPTEGFDYPSGLSSGGVSPEAMGNPLTAGDIADAVSSQLIPVLSTLPYASAPGESSSGGAGNGVTELVATIQGLRDAGLIQTAPPAASTGAASSQPASHTKPAHVSERVNRQKGNPRSGQTYRVLVNPQGHAKGTYHVYGTGKKTEYIRVKK